MADRTKPKNVGGIRTLIYDAAIFSLLYLVGVIVSWKNVRSQTKSFAPEIEGSGEYPVERAEFLFELGQRASDHTDAKAKHLLALTSSLCTLFIAFASYLEPEWLVWLPGVPLFLAAVLGVIHLGVRIETRPVPIVNDRNGTLWARDVLKSYRDNEERRLFLVDLFAAARRWFLVAFVCFFVLLGFRWLNADSPGLIHDCSQNPQALVRVLEDLVGVLSGIQKAVHECPWAQVTLTGEPPKGGSLEGKLLIDPVGQSGDQPQEAFYSRTCIECSCGGED